MINATVQKSSMPDQPVEKRCEKRRKQPIFIDILPAGRNRSIQAVTTDISVSGAGLIIGHRLPLGSAIKLSSDGKYTATAKVVNLAPSDLTGLMRVGVEFTEKDRNWPW